MMTSNASDPPVVAVVSSPSTNVQLTLDVVGEHSASNLIGALVGFRWDQSNPLNDSQTIPTRVLGQITSIQMRNRWHEDQAFKNIIKSNKTLPAITPQQDTRTAVMKIGGCFVQTESRGHHSHGDLGGVPSTGTNVLLVDQRFLDAALQSCSEDLFYLGRAYGSDIKFPMWFKHFGAGGHGVGEAYHIGVFGKTGSGKTGLVKMLLAGYARHPEMGILVIDPQGEFSLEFGGNRVGSQDLDIREIVQDKLDRELVLAPISKVQLDDWNLLEELLESSRFFDIGLGIRGNTEREAAKSYTIQRLRDSFEIDEIHEKECGKAILRHLWTKAQNEIYKTKPNWEVLRSRLNHFQEDGWDQFNIKYWQPVTTLFRSGKGKHRIEDLVSALTQNESRTKPIVVLDLSSQSGVQSWSDTLQKRIISHIAEKLVENSSSTLASNVDTANTLVVLDEAHRFVPYGGNSQLDDESRMLRSELKRAVRETRKYGVGWMFISQTMQGLDTEILMQLRSMFFGYGLSFGLEYRRLQELAGGDDEAMNLYRSFRDPQSAINPESKQFPFMAIGPVSPMPFAGQPMFFSAFNGSDFVSANAWELFREEMHPDTGHYLGTGLARKP